MYTCARCGVVFPSRQALGGHRSTLTCPPMTRANVPVTTRLGLLEVATDADVSDPQYIAAHVDAPTSQSIPAVPAVAPVTPFTIVQLLQRPKKKDNETHIVAPVEVEISRTCDETNTFKLHETQDAYDEFCRVIRSNYTDEFWRIFATVYREKNTVIDKVLKGCRDVFVKSKGLKRRFEVCRNA